MSRSDTGMLAGAGVGGLAGSLIGEKGSMTKTVAMGIGAILGGFVGRKIGDVLTQRDKEKQAAAAQKAMASQFGASVPWNNPESGHYGCVTTSPVYTPSSPQLPANAPSQGLCRQVTMQCFVKNDRGEMVKNDVQCWAVMQPNGQWQLAS